MTILHYADGDLRTLINELDVDQLTAENSGELVYNHIKETYEEYIDEPLATAAEKLFVRLGWETSKGRDPSRKNGLFKEMDRAKFPLPNEGKGYLLLRDAMLGPRACGTINTWTHG